MDTKDKVIDSLWETSSHGTRREDIEEAYNAGVVAAREEMIALGWTPPALHRGKDREYQDRRDKVTEVVAYCLHYLDRCFNAGHLFTAEEVQEATSGGKDRYFRDPIYKAKVSFFVEKLMAAITPAEETREWPRSAVVVPDYIAAQREMNISARKAMDTLSKK